MEAPKIPALRIPVRTTLTMQLQDITTPAVVMSTLSMTAPWLPVPPAQAAPIQVLLMPAVLIPTPLTPATRISASLALATPMMASAAVPVLEGPLDTLAVSGRHRPRDSLKDALPHLREHFDKEMAGLNQLVEHFGVRNEQENLEGPSPCTVEPQISNVHRPRPGGQGGPVHVSKSSRSNRHDSYCHV